MATNLTETRHGASLRLLDHDPTAELHLSGDMKTSVHVRNRASGLATLDTNAYGLPAGITCPGQTPDCLVCYANRIEVRRPDTHRALVRNLELLLACRGSVAKMTELIGRMIARYRRTSHRAGMPRIFRIHWDGDFFSVAYAKAWRKVIEANPDIRFWVYTRSFQAGTNVVPILADLPNLALYLSVDSHNIARATRVARQHPTVKVAVLAPTAEVGHAMLERMGRRRAPLCPEVAGKLPLAVTADRRRNLADTDAGTDGMGACAACMLCVRGTADVVFLAEQPKRSTLTVPTPVTIGRRTA